MRRYRTSGAVCRACPAFGTCTKDARYGRALEIGPHDAALRVHREWMSTEEASRSYERRQGLIEPVFGIIKDQQAGRRFLLRGIANVAAEWTLLATAFNLRTLWQAGADMWRHGTYLLDGNFGPNLGMPAAPDRHPPRTRAAMTRQPGPPADPTNQCSAPHHHQQPFVRQAPLDSPNREFLRQAPLDSPFESHGG